MGIAKYTQLRRVQRPPVHLFQALTQKREQTRRASERAAEVAQPHTGVGFELGPSGFRGEVICANHLEAFSGTAVENQPALVL